MKPFQNMPTYKTWESKSSAAFALRSSDRVLKQIDSLVKAYWRVPTSQTEVAYQLYRATSYWMKNVGVKFKGTDRRMDAVENLHTYVKGSFARMFDVPAQDVDDLLPMIFGKPVHVAYEDSEVFNEARTVQYIQDDVARKKYKLVFRKGLACKRTDDGLEVYDTKDEEGKDGTGEAIFVMDRYGRIYTSSYSRGEFHHSSFLAGKWSLAAGTMKVTRGQVETIAPDSGHYQPGPQQMLNLVERLKTYGVDLRRLTVNLFVYETEGQHKGQAKQKHGLYVWNSTRGDLFLNRRGTF
ncbi:MAG: hypothetical protein ACRC33_22450 [Gemmataceae bacterium]